ncbi:hypothetical protein [Bacillus mycoides]|uniref:hypothetical protein n=1 Tax=Bacillus mycoides TaxID=1405 RepID=UPI000A27B003|nr:hypothetical protein [Bacillus mycoides]OSY02627.1 hypothetical protein BTJ44_05684 [Bacillus mycoides]
MKYVDVFKKSIADELEKRGHVPYKTRPNWKIPKYDVYVFENTVAFSNDMKQLTGLTTK